MAAAPAVGAGRSPSTSVAASVVRAAQLLIVSILAPSVPPADAVQGGTTVPGRRAPFGSAWHGEIARVGGPRVRASVITLFRRLTMSSRIAVLCVLATLA